MTTLSVVPDGIEPWDKRPEETDAAFHGFGHYRDLGTERSIVKAVEEHRGCNGGKGRASLQTWEQWSSKHGWPERVSAWDRKLDKAKQQGLEAEAIEVGRRHARMAAAALEVLSAPGLALAEVMSEEDLVETVRTVAKSSPSGFLAALDLVKTMAKEMPNVAKMEREALGLGDEEQQQTTVKVVVKLDDEFRL